MAGAALGAVGTGTNLASYGVKKKFENDLEGEVKLLLQKDKEFSKKLAEGFEVSHGLLSWLI